MSSRALRRQQPPGIQCLFQDHVHDPVAVRAHAALDRAAGDRVAAHRRHFGGVARFLVALRPGAAVAARDLVQLIKDKDVAGLREKIGEKAKAATEDTVLKIASKWAEKLASPSSSDSMAMASLVSSLKAAVKRAKEISEETEVSNIQMMNGSMWNMFTPLRR